MMITSPSWNTIILISIAFSISLISIIYLLLIFLSPQDPIPTPSESTYISTSSEQQVSFALPSLLTSSPTLELSIIVPAYNESLRLEKMLRPCIDYLENRKLSPPDPPQEEQSKLLPRGIVRGSYEVLIVDDGSKDDTVKVASSLAKELQREFGGKRGEVKICSLKRNRGKGGATKHGVLHASGHRILFVDADGATEFEDLQLLERELDLIEIEQQHQQRRRNPKEDGDEDFKPHGIVVGSRAHLIETEAVVKRSLLRNLLMRCFHLYLSLLGLSTIRDTQCGFKLHTRQSALHLYPHLHSSGWIFDCELLLLAERCRVPLREVGVRWNEVGGSKLNVVKDSIRMAVDLIVIRANHALGRWKCPERIDLLDRVDESKQEGKKDQ